METRNFLVGSHLPQGHWEGPVGLEDRGTTFAMTVTAQYTQWMCLRVDPFTHWPQKP